MGGRTSQPMWNQLIQLSFRSKISLQAQIRELLVAAILDGHLPVGVALPSTRVLAEQLGVARNTVALAYELLVNDGYLLTRSRSGHFVNPEILAGRAQMATTGASSEPAARASSGRSGFASRHRASATSSSAATGRRIRYPFIYGQFDPTLMPIAGWRECSNQALSVSEIRGWAADLIDGDDPLLLEQIQARLLARRGVWATPDEILVTVGAQHALFLLATLLVGPATSSASRIRATRTRATSSPRARMRRSDCRSTARGSRCRRRSSAANTFT